MRGAVNRKNQLVAENAWIPAPGLETSGAGSAGMTNKSPDLSAATRLRSWTVIIDRPGRESVENPAGGPCAPRGATLGFNAPNTLP